MKKTSGNKHSFLQEILSETEPELFLKLRCHCLSSPDASEFAQQHNKAIDINYYDNNSLHYGAYLHVQQHAAPVGYLRIVVIKQTIADVCIKGFAQKFSLPVINNRKPVSPFPFIGINHGMGLEQEFFAHIASIESTGKINGLSIVEQEGSLMLAVKMIRSAIANTCLHLQQTVAKFFRLKIYPRTPAFTAGAASQQRQPLILFCKTDFIEFEWQQPIQQLRKEFMKENCLPF